MNSSTTRVVAFGGIAALLLVVVWYVALFRPESHHLSSAHVARAAAEAKVETLNNQIAQLKALEKRIPQDTALLGTLKSNVPDTPDLSDALGQLHSAATSSSVQLSAVSPAPPPVRGTGAAVQSGPPSIALTMSATGTYPQLMSFMTHLDKMARTVVINSVGIASGNNSVLTASLNAQIFYAGSPTP